MVERLIQTIKRKLGVMAIDPLWSSEDISSIVSNIIQSIRLIPNRITKVTPFEAHFGRKPNTALSNIVTKPNKQNLSYKQIKHFTSDRKLLKQPVLSPSAIWNMDQDSEPELNVLYKDTVQQQRQHTRNSTPDSDNSENAPLLSPMRTPGKIIPSKLEITFGDKTSTLIYGRKQVARKTKARKAPEPRGTLKPQWNIIENGTITNYSPHTITLDTNNRKNTVIRKNDLAIITQQIPLQETQNPPQKRLIHMVACKSLREYNNNKEKIKQFCLEEKRLKKLKQQQLLQGSSNTHQKTPDGELYSHEQIVSIAKKNQREQQQKRRNIPKRESNTKKQQQSKTQTSQQLPPNRRTKHTMPPKVTTQKTTAKRRVKQNPSDTFIAKSKAAALNQSRIHMEKQQNRSFIKIDEQELQKSPTIEVVTISDSTENSPIKIYTSENKYDFMLTSPSSPEIPQNFTSTISIPKIDKVVTKIQKLKTTPTLTTSPIPQNQIPCGTSKPKDQETNTLKLTEERQLQPSSSNYDPLDNTPQTLAEQVKDEGIPDQQEEHFSASSSPAKSSISEIKAGDFYEEEFQE